MLQIYLQLSLLDQLYFLPFSIIEVQVFKTIIKEFNFYLKNLAEGFIVDFATIYLKMDKVII